MAITFRRIDAPALPADLGTRGFEAVRITGDGAATTVLVTLPADSGIKTIKGCAVGYAASHNIPLAGVAAATGFTITFVTAPGNTLTFDALIWGDGR